MENEIYKNLNALERACEEVLDAETLKAVVAAKRRIQGEPEREIVSRRSIKIPIEIVPTCSMAAMREAVMRKAVIETQSVIAKCMDILNKIPDGCGYGGLIDDVADELCDLREEHIKAALAAPPRNCDVGTPTEQAERWYWRYHIGHLCQSCPLGPRKWSEIDAGTLCFSEWLQMPNKEGGAK